MRASRSCEVEVSTTQLKSSMIFEVRKRRLLAGPLNKKSGA